MFKFALVILCSIFSFPAFSDSLVGVASEAEIQRESPVSVVLSIVDDKNPQLLDQINEDWDAYLSEGRPVWRLQEIDTLMLKHIKNCNLAISLIKQNPSDFVRAPNLLPALREELKEAISSRKSLAMVRRERHG